MENTAPLYVQLKVQLILTIKRCNFLPYLSRIIAKADSDTLKKLYTINMRFQLAMTRSCTIPHESLQTMERTEIVVGRIVAPEFYMGGPGSQDILKGHFKCSREWLVAKLNMVLNDCCRVCRESKEEDDLEEAELVQQVTLRLTKGLPKPFTENDKTHELTVLFHDDLSARNILVDKNGVATAVLDWELASAFPLYKACQLLKFLDGTKQMQMTTQEGFRCDENRGIGEEFWEYMQDYEKIQLRQVFLEEMERVEPAWVKEYRRSTVKADFESAVDIADSGWLQESDQWMAGPAGRGSMRDLVKAAKEINR